MIASLYICNRSFQWNGKDSLEDFKKKMSNLQLMLEKVNENKSDNWLFVFKEGLLNTLLLPDVKFHQLLGDYRFAIQAIGHDCYTILMGLLKHCRETTATIFEIKEYLKLEDDNNCHGVIVFSPIKSLESYFQVISTRQGWYNFRRYYLAKYPKNPDYFLDESKKYFPYLKIHEGCHTSLRDVIYSHPIKIVHYLSVLNDFFIQEFTDSGLDLVAFLPLFADKYHIEDASLEGNKDDKFYFLYDGKLPLNAYCEAHLKMYKDDSKNNNQHCRIYFRKPMPGEKELYVGYIGCHL